MAEEPRREALLLAEAVRAGLAPVAVEAGETVVREGEAGRGFYFVESGALDVVVGSEADVRFPVARLGPGSHFGEMSLLAGTPVSADVVASEPSVVYVASPEEFDRLIRGDPRLMDYLAGELALRLKQTNLQLAAQQQREATLRRLIGSRPTTALNADLPSLRRLKPALEEAGASDRPLLITGEAGVGKKALALHLHAQGARRDAPVLLVDCRDLPPQQARSQLFGDARPDLVNRFAPHLGYLQAADRGTLILANVDRLPSEVQEDLATFLRTHWEPSQEGRVAVRVIATARSAAQTTGPEPGLSGPLLEAFAAGHQIDLRPLRQRRRDIVPLAEHLLDQEAQRGNRPPMRLGESAKRELRGYDFRFENVEELRQVIALAANLAEGDAINAEHLFFGPGGGPETAQVDLLRWPRLEALLHRGQLMTGLKVLVALVFAGIVAACLALPNAAPGRMANLMVWGLWWPVLVIASLLLGRIWCALCPLSSGAEAVQRAGGRGFAPPDRLRNVGPALAVIGFAAIIWIEYMTGMAETPRYTAALLIGLAAIAGVLGWLFQRHTWCRYLCPLGAMGAAFGVAGALRVQARREVCQASCTGHECYKGSADAKGCPMFNHALFLSSGQHCKLCFECLRACPERSPRLVLRLPLLDVWRSNLIATEVAPLAAVIGLLALLLAATPGGDVRSAVHRWWFSAGAVGAVAVGLALLRLFRGEEAAAGSADLSWVARGLYAFAPAVAALLFAFHVRAFPWIGDSLLRLNAFGADRFQVSLLQLAQGAAAAAGGLMTLWALWRLCRRRFEASLAAALAAWGLLALLTAGYLVGGLFLLNRS